VIGPHPGLTTTTTYDADGQAIEMVQAFDAEVSSRRARTTRTSGWRRGIVAADIDLTGATITVEGSDCVL